jgi:NAD(P)-dependent dehydrogenase (short-subunit alcohol dehydrogenase family)
VSNNADHANGTTEAIVAEGNNGTAFTGDCTNVADIERLLKTTVETYGQVDCVINAGVYDAQPNGFAKLDEDTWERSMNLNLNAQYHIIRTFLPQMEEQAGGGNFVFVSTIAASVGLGLGPQRHGYAAGKAAATVLTRRIGVEYAKAGVRGNVIEAGYVASPLVTRAVSQAGADHAKVAAGRDAYTPRGLQGQPEDVAKACVFLGSDDASFINGVVLPVDGGTSSVTYGP